MDRIRCFLSARHLRLPFAPVREETSIGALYEQVIEPPHPFGATAVVKAVGWSPSLPSMGELAVGSGDCVFIYRSGSGGENGSFCWRQIAGLEQSSTIEGIRWTGSGDGLIAVGSEVVLWRKKNDSWEGVWRSSSEHPQNMVSATWSIQGLVATAACYVPSQIQNSPSGLRAGKCVSVYYNDKTELMKAELLHPQPVSTIQWRPAVVKSGMQAPRKDFLLTCSFDGAVRLWGEIDSGRPRGPGKEAAGQKSKRSFHVVSVIEVNHILEGKLGIDTKVRWATETHPSGAKSRLFPLDSEQDLAGNCEWLVGLGPQKLLSLWAIHCLDDISPVRFPRMTLWKKQHVQDSKVVLNTKSESSNSGDFPILVQAVISRQRLFGPPVTCSLLELLPDNGISWSILHRGASSNVDVGSSPPPSKGDVFSSFSGGFLFKCGHTGKILQVCLHPCIYEVQIAATLDSDGLLLFWNLSTISGLILWKPTLFHPTLKLLGGFFDGELSTSSAYKSLGWAPLLLKTNPLLLLGNADGIDCFIIKISESNAHAIVNHKICTIPFHGNSQVDAPDHILTLPLLSTSSDHAVSQSFLLLAVWVKDFQAVSWNVVLHVTDPSEGIDASKSCSCESNFDGKRLYIFVNLCSSKFPYPHDSDQVTSFAVVCPNTFILSTLAEKPAYQLATGCSNGTVKLWRTSLESRPEVNLDTMLLPWELVGMFTPHEGPVTAISLCNTGAHIATMSQVGSGSPSNFYLWECKCLDGMGCFSIEDKITVDREVVSGEWITIGNGQLLFAVCLQDELRIYAPKRTEGQILIKSRKSMDTHFWVCVASACFQTPARGFLWGPRVGAVLVHDTYLSLFSQWTFCTDLEKWFMTGSQRSEATENMYLRINEYKQCDFILPEEGTRVPGSKTAFISILDIVEKLNESLPIYHPEALFIYLCSGNLRRANFAVKHLMDHLSSGGKAKIYMEGHSCLKLSTVIPQIHLSQYFEEPISKSGSDQGLQWGGHASPCKAVAESWSSVYDCGPALSVSSSENMLNTSAEKSVATGFSGALEKFHDIEGINSMSRIQLLAMVDLLDEVKDPRYASIYESLDEGGRRFWIAVKFQKLCLLRRNAWSAASEELVVGSELTAWAFQSDCQASLLHSLLSNESSWLDMKNLGVGYWFTDVAQLRTRMEKLARSQYLKRKEAKDCALLYLALNRLQVLTGLFKISKDEKDKPLVGFLSRNFQEERNKAAALKNAYVLMGKHQLELAIAFFLLGGDFSSAVTVCAKNFGDEQLALIICRLLEGCGGPLECHLISDFLLPNAAEKGDYWLVSLFQCTLGNYSQSFSDLLGVQKNPTVSRSDISKRVVFSEPNVGQYCMLLAAKNKMKNSVGEFNAAVMAKWASMMASTALRRCGLPLEALECIWTSSINPASKDQFYASRSGPGDAASGNKKWTLFDFSDWISGDVACCLEVHTKNGLAMSFISKIIREHPNWMRGDIICEKECETDQYKRLLDNNKQKLKSAISILEKKYSLALHDLFHMILLFTCTSGMAVLGFCDLHDCMYHELDCDRHLDAPLLEQFKKTSKEIFYLLVRNIADWCLTCSSLKQTLCQTNITTENKLFWFHPWYFHVRVLICFFGNLRLLLEHHNPCLSEDAFVVDMFSGFELLEYSLYYALAWVQRQSGVLILMSRPILNALGNRQNREIVVVDLRKSLHQIMKLVTENALSDNEGNFSDGASSHGTDGKNDLSLPDDEKWQLIGVSLLGHLSCFVNDQLAMLNIGNENGEFMSRLLQSILVYVSSSITRQLESNMIQKLEAGLHVPMLAWLEKTKQPLHQEYHHYLTQEIDSIVISKQSNTFLFEILWQISADSRGVSEDFAAEAISHMLSISKNNSRLWTDFQRGVIYGHENDETPKPRDKHTGSGFDSENSEKRRHQYINYFHNPKELCKRNGELLEAMCINSIFQKQIALASNRKGLIFYNWEREDSIIREDYIWSESDWPRNGWAHSESTPIPTYVSPGVGLGTKKGTHLGLGGATIGQGSQARPGKDLTGGGAFGIPGYAGIGASGLGWGEQQDFEFDDPPATVGNISTRALSSHPSRPLLLVGSSNTHVYLWEFGKERATATYGVLPAANVPPPYAIASISAVQFDRCGHRFATAALDGTVCTWQLEVGGRSNVRPTESSLCFSGHASDVAYVASSGSVIAAAGYSSNGASIVIWDTLAPPSTSRASLICHEGGAKSLSVFDNNTGSGSISPVIVMGGKDGDVGLHDFRFITTGRTKRPKHPTLMDESKSSAQSPAGMLWYIPKAHQGSVTRISTIPNTSLFLTGSKDGDVKLWDAKRRQLLFHWQKMHERHTFLQPGSRGFGGVVRAGVTDIEVLPYGFLTCGGDGTVKLVEASKFWKTP